MNPTARASVSNVQTPEDKVLSKGFAAYMDGHDKAALSYFEEVLRINPKNTAARTGLEKVKIRLRKVKDVEAGKAKVLAKAKLKEGREMARTGDLVPAIDSFHEALDAIPDYKPAKKELQKIKNKMNSILANKKFNLSNWSFARGVLAYLDRDWAKAYRVWSERLRIEPSNVSLANATARSENNFKKMMLREQEDFFRRGARAFYEQGLYREAKSSWEKLVALKPEDLEGLEGVARSEEAILRAQGKGRDNKIHDLLEEGLGYYARQNWLKAREVFVRLTQLDPNFETAKDYVAKINKILESQEYNPVTVAGGESWRNRRASNQGSASVQVPDKLENFSESRKDLESQLKRDPANIKIQQELDKVVKSQEDESERIYKDGLIAYSQGNRTMAIQQWKQVLVINPEHKKAAAALKKAKAEEERTPETAEAQ